MSSSKNISVQKALELIFQESHDQSEDESVDLSNVEYSLDFESTSESSMDKDSELLPHPPESNQAIYISKNGKMEWAKTPTRQPPLKSEDTIKMKPGPTIFAVSHVSHTLSSFELFLFDSIQKIILDMTNLKGGCISAISGPLLAN
ncbi:unnamed protein product [Lepeophtheirus salmonis]|uniref:(salmon louse) hypothetical protein n=1 Tax=Lepeophtheirus salmonis TaxID=72036 RepID=A0A7R8D4I5_LEPSM|nr:unnamed protein product [Lepeophtheirus salmonis]CAF2996044.1 unnamed protein product [Lepeophtheirus salmonis]